MSTRTKKEEESVRQFEANLLAGNQIRVAEMIRNKMNVNATLNGRPMLHYAIEGQNLNIVDMVLSAGADLTSTDEDGGDAFEVVENVATDPATRASLRRCLQHHAALRGLPQGHVRAPPLAHTQSQLLAQAQQNTAAVTALQASTPVYPIRAPTAGELRVNSQLYTVCTQALDAINGVTERLARENLPYPPYYTTTTTFNTSNTPVNTTGSSRINQGNRESSTSPPPSKRHRN